MIYRTHREFSDLIETRDGQKIESETRIQQIRSRLLDVILSAGPR